MPGLFGILAKNPALPDERLRWLVTRMSDALRMAPWLGSELWVAPGFAGGRVHLGLMNPSSQPLVHVNPNARMWFDGQVYPPDGDHGISPEAEQVLQLAGDPEELARIEGVFAFAVFYPDSAELVLATDRLGFRPLYWAETVEWFAYASEVKALLAILDAIPPVDEVSLRQFFSYDYMLGERTWWQPIRLVPPASLWRITPSGRVGRPYWSFESIRREPRDERELTDELHRLWATAIAKRARPGTTPILLSGGLDSRLVLAELVAQGRDVLAVTFGERGCRDLLIAAEAARTAAVLHRRVLVDGYNWWTGRDQTIWSIDGLVNAHHLHVSVALDLMRGGNRWSLKHSSGDTLFGGSKLSLFGPVATQPAEERDWRKGLETFLTKAFRANPFFSVGDVAEVSTPDCEPYLCGPSTDCFVMRQVQRRRTLTGPLAMGTHCEVLNPAATLVMMRLLLGGLNDSARKGGRFYHRFLTSVYPQLFRNIPYQRTDRGLSETAATRIRRGLAGKLRRALKMEGSHREFLDYPRLVAEAQLGHRLAGATLLLDDVMGGRVHEALARVVPPPPRVLLGIYTVETYLRRAAGWPGLQPPGPIEQRVEVG
jgi:asparagine synthase (glutamine-hydrolysing)